MTVRFKRRRSIRAARFVLLLAVILSQHSDVPAQVFPFRYYTARDGLLSDAGRFITQDASGYLWIGTTEGVSVFDGVSFRNLTILEGLSNSNVNWIAESRTAPGTMWVATNGGGCLPGVRGRSTSSRAIGMARTLRRTLLDILCASLS